MERMLVVVFDDESKAYEATQALTDLDLDGSITIHAESVITKNADGTVAIKQADGDYPIRTVGGTAIGSLIGVLGGPVGVGIGALAGMAAGSFGDLFVAAVDSDFLSEVSETLVPGKHAVVADISEEWVTPVDTRMEALHGTVFRTARTSFIDEQQARDIAELQAEIDQMDAELDQASGEAKAKLQAKVDQAKAKLQDKRAKAKQRSAQLKSETEAKVEALRKKAAKAQGDAKAALDSRLNEIRQRYEQSAEKVRSLVA
jgi:uncharacterized membrane protein